MHLDQLIHASLEPVDPEVFMYLYGVGVAAMTRALPVQSPAAKGRAQGRDGQYEARDTPLTRMMVAVSEECTSLNLAQSQCMGYIMRMSSMGDFTDALMAHDPTQARRVDGGLEIPDAILKAYAGTALAESPDGMSLMFDIPAIIAASANYDRET